MSTEETKTAGKGQAARNAAIKRLIAEFGERFTELHTEERKARGLFPIMGKQPTKDELKEQNEKLRATLIAHGINPDEV